MPLWMTDLQLSWHAPSQLSCKIRNATPYPSLPPESPKFRAQDPGPEWERRDGKAGFHTSGSSRDLAVF